MSAETDTSNQVLKKRLSDLPPAKRAVLERLLKAESTESRILPRNRALDPPPLSFAQQRLWFLDRLAPNRAFYNETGALHLKTQLDVPTLERALNEIVRRHESLRTTFPDVDGKPVQVIAPFLHVPIRFLDLHRLPSPVRDREARRIADAEALQPFDLGRGPLITAALLQLGHSNFLFLTSMHHIVYDGWSWSIFLNELRELYEAFAQGHPSPLPEPELQYADFTSWQHSWLRGPVLSTQLDYWKRQLAGLGVLQLPADRQRPAVQTYRGARIPITIDGAVFDALKELSLREGATLFMTLLAAFQVLLHRYSGQDDIVVGVPTAGRVRKELEGLIGFFVNTLVMRTDLSGDPDFREALRRVRKVALEAYEHQDVPFEKLVEELRPDRDLSRNPLFQVTFQLLTDSGGYTPELPSEAAAQSPPIQIETGTAKFDLRCELTTGPGGLTGFFEYSSDLFEAATVARMSQHLSNLLADIAKRPDVPISALKLMAPEEESQMLVEWNQTARDFPDDACVHELIELQARRAPDAVALTFEGRQLTYGEYDRAANRLARYLQKLGVGPDALVALCMERSFEMLIGLLGILKAGGAFVPLDTASPDERLGFMLSDSGASVLITQAALRHRFGACPATVVCLDEAWPAIERESGGSPPSGATANNLAWMIYTSGSTGIPKGALVEHRGACNLSSYNRRTFEVDASSRVLQFASLSFDASAFEIVTALPAGATLCLATQDSVMPGPALASLMKAERISFALLTPSALSVMPDTPLPDLKALAVAGETFPLELVDRWASGRRLFNLYGPTETSVLATVAECRVGDARMTIGRPIDNVRCYVLGANRQPVPVGVAGELFIGGAGVGRGYWNRPDLTAERFIADPYSPDAGARLYKTGDLVRYLPDGALEFFGRLDYQVKIRAYRIELGEIESALSRHPAIRGAVVSVREDMPGDKRLVAYVVRHKGVELSSGELLRFLQGILPPYMAPSAFVFLDALPLTNSGKIDRNALPSPPAEREDGAGFVLPRTEMERALGAIWRDLLHINRIGVHDNFFDVGGHSLLIVRLHSRVKELTGDDVAIIDLFRHSTIASLAEFLTTPSSTVEAASESYPGSRLEEQPQPAGQRRRSVAL